MMNGRRYERIAPDRCRRCRRLVVRPRRYAVTDSIAMLVCRNCNSFLRYETRGGDGA